MKNKHHVISSLETEYCKHSKGLVSAGAQWCSLDTVQRRLVSQGEENVADGEKAFLLGYKSTSCCQAVGLSACVTQRRCQFLVNFPFSWPGSLFWFIEPRDRVHRASELLFPWRPDHIYMFHTFPLKW